MKVSITSDDSRLRSKLNINQTLIFTKKSFFYTMLGFTQSGSLKDTADFSHFIAGFYKTEKIFNITSVDKVHLKTDGIDGSIVNGVREPTLYNFTPVKLSGHKIFNKIKNQTFQKDKQTCSVSYHVLSRRWWPPQTSWFQRGNDIIWLPISENKYL